MLLKKNQNNIRTFLVYVFIASLSLLVWMSIILLLDFLLVVKFYTYNKISDDLATSVLVVTALVTATFFSHLKKLSSRSIFLLILVLSFATASSKYLYDASVASMKALPRVKSLSKNWSIQGDVVAIEGVNFGESPGSVSVGVLNFIIVSWNDRFIKVKQPVPDAYATGFLIVCNGSHSCSREIPFTISDPADVL